MNEQIQDIAILGAASSWGAAYGGCEHAPMALWRAGLAVYLQHLGLNADWFGICEITPGASDHDPALWEVYDTILRYNQSLAREVAELVDANHFPVVVGGDHSVAMGTWAGIIAAHKAAGKFGLLWCDAHMDAHTPVSASQGKWGGHFHGTPLAHLLGHGDRDLSEIAGKKAKLAGKYVALIGTRSYEPAEQAFLQKMGVRVFDMLEIKQRGLQAVLHDALQIVGAAPKGWGISFDADMLAPRDMPAVGTPEAGGISFKDCLQAFETATWPEGCCGFELVEYLPHKDPTGLYAKKLVQLAGTLLSKIKS